MSWCHTSCALAPSLACSLREARLQQTAPRGREWQFSESLEPGYLRVCHACVGPFHAWHMTFRMNVDRALCARLHAPCYLSLPLCESRGTEACARVPCRNMCESWSEGHTLVGRRNTLSNTVGRPGCMQLLHPRRRGRACAWRDMAGRAACLDMTTQCHGQTESHTCCAEDNFKTCRPSPKNKVEG